MGLSASSNVSYQSNDSGAGISRNDSSSTVGTASFSIPWMMIIVFIIISIIGAAIGLYMYSSQNGEENYMNRNRYYGDPQYLRMNYVQ